MSSATRDQLIASRDALLAEYKERLRSVQNIRSSKLAHKYDALPLLDYPERLQYMQEFYPLLKVQSIQKKGPIAPGTPHTSGHHNRYITNVTLAIDDSLSIALQYSTENSRLLDLTITQISHHRLDLDPLIQYCERTHNLSFFLLGCYEYTRLCKSRACLWSNLATAFGYLTPTVRSKSCFQLSSRKASLLLKIRFIISFDHLPFPSSTVSVDLESDAGTTPHANEVCSALIKEYGLEHGLTEFIKAVMA
ncbi:LAFA_0A05248g1_1 [Lachancea sp. 'fantastica']|nr:LAFA_0A05248g1_1 [Lachancea sp. 'fantastica']